tara:strand:- start:259 stop:567 length:309 start_codon:yes stop_codon:yes gene_type:complete
MLKKLKQFLGLGQGDTSTIPESIANAVNSDNITPTNTLTIKPTGKDAVKVKKYTKASLGKLTKQQLEEIARSEYGIELDRRKKKDELVSTLLREQKTASKKG